jgi:hypothetical protein
MHIDLSRSEIEAALQTIELALTGYRTVNDRRARPAPGQNGATPALDQATLATLRQKLNDVCTLSDDTEDLDFDLFLEPADA